MLNHTNQIRNRFEEEWIKPLCHWILNCWLTSNEKMWINDQRLLLISLTSPKVVNDMVVIIPNLNPSRGLGVLLKMSAKRVLTRGEKSIYLC